MKRFIIVSGLFLSAGFSHAVPIFRTVQMSSDTTFAPTLQTGAINISSGTIRNLNVPYGVVAGTVTGAGLSSCGDATHALSWGSGLFGCQAISAGGGGSTALEVFVGSTRSSPTASISGYTGDFTGSVTGSTFTLVLNPATTDFIHNQTSQQTATANISSASIFTQLNLPYATTGFLLYNTGAGNIGGNSTLTWDSSAGAMVLGGGLGDATSWLTINGASSLSPILINTTGDGVNVADSNFQAVTPYRASNSSVAYSESMSASGNMTLNVQPPVVSRSFIPSLTLQTNNTVGGSGLPITMVLSSSGLDISTQTVIHGSATVSGVNGLGVTYGVNAGSFTGTGLTASLPVQTDSNKTLTSAAIDLSGTQATGTMAAGREPAHTGDVTNSAGSLAMSANPLQPNITTFSSSITVNGLLGEKVAFGLNVGSMTGAGLTTCGDGTHALAWASSNNLFTCQAITGTGGGGGASTLEVLAGVSRTSPTVTIGFPATEFVGTVASSSMTVTLNASSVTMQGNTFNGASQLVQLNGSTQFPAVSGALITNITGANIATVIPSGVLPSTVAYTTLANNFTSSQTITAPLGLNVTFGITASTYTGDVMVTSPTAVSKATGTKIVLVSSGNYTFGTVGYIAVDGSVHISTADVIADANAVVMCADATCSAGASANWLLHGEASFSGGTWTVGGLIYLSTTGTSGNTLTQTAPSGANNVIQILGIAIDRNRILFMPNLVQTEHT